MMQEILAYAAVYVAEALITGVYLDYLFDKKRKLWLHLLSFALTYGILFGLSMWNIPILNAICFILVNFLLIIFLYRCGIKTAVIHAAFLCFLVLAGELLVSLIITLFGYSFSAYTQNFAVMLTLIIWSKLLYMVFSAIGALIFLPHKAEAPEPGAMALFCILPIGSVAVTSAIVYIGMRTGINHVTVVIITITVAALLVMNLLFFSIYNHVQRINREHIALQLALQRDQAEAIHYQALQEQFDNQRILVHDMKNHLHTIRSLADKGENNQICEYIQQLDASLQAIPQARLCSDVMLNMLLLRFREDCRREGIQFQCDIRDHILDFMEASDITTLFGNLLNNAHEAASGAQDRQAELSVRRSSDQSAVVITLNNTCAQAPQTDGAGNFLTHKKDRIRHGVGLKSIQRVVKKYGGIEMLQYDTKTMRFCHIIHIPDKPNTTTSRGNV